MSEPARLALRHPGGRSELRIGAGAVGDAAGEIRPWLAGRTLFVLSSPPVRRLHGAVLDPWRDAARRVVELDAPDGEEAKTVGEAERLWRAMLAQGGKRDSRLAALGGGTVGDLGGFVAGCFLRGIAVAQVPTTLLAQVDAAIGGKTGVDLEEGKNAVGLFHHPDWVVADTALLATLAAGDLRAGLVEAIKMAFLLDLDLFERLERDLERALAGDPAALAPIVAGAAAAKVGVVERDPAEGGWRRVLNFGHTLGHAIETALGYRQLRHGEAVGYGLLFALRLARRRGLEAAAAERLRALVARLGLPALPALDPGRLLALLGRDKKAGEAGLTWVLPRRPGEVEMATDVAPEVVASELDAFLADPLAPAL